MFLSSSSIDVVVAAPRRARSASETWCRRRRLPPPRCRSVLICLSRELQSQRGWGERGGVLAFSRRRDASAALSWESSVRCSHDSDDYIIVSEAVSLFLSSSWWQAATRLRNSRAGGRKELGRARHSPNTLLAQFTVPSAATYARSCWEGRVL